MRKCIIKEDIIKYVITTDDGKIRHGEKNLNLIQIQLLTIGKSNPNKKARENWKLDPAMWPRFN